MEEVRAPAIAIAALCLAIPGGALAESVATDEAAIRIEVANAAPVLGLDHETDITITVGPPQGDTQMPTPQVKTSTGTIADLVRRSANRFTARLVFPEQRFPQVAILAAETRVDGKALSGVTVVPLSAVASPAFETDPGAEVTLTIGDKVFGPERASETGEVRVPVVVPPGIETGLARTVNRAHRVAEQTLDLGVPDFDRVLILAPDSVALAGPAWVTVHAIDRKGQLLPGDKLQLWADDHRAHAIETTDHGRRFLAYPLATSAGEQMNLKAAVAGDSSTQARATAQVSVTAGPPSRLSVESGDGGLRIGSLRTVVVTIRAQDAGDNLAPTAGTSVFVDGRPATTEIGPDETLVLTLSAPVRYQGRDHVTVEALLNDVYVREAIPLHNLPRFAQKRGPPMNPILNVGVRGGMLWTIDQAAGGALTIESFARHPAWPRALFAGLDVTLLRNEVFGGDTTGLVRARLLQVPLLATVRVRARVRSNLEFFVGGGVGMNVINGRLTGLGAQLTGTTLTPALKAAAEIAFTLGRDQAVLGASYLWAGNANISDGDRLRGNPAGLVIDAGYRWRY